MGLKRRLSRFNQGWLPKEPILPTRVAPSQTKPGKTRAFLQNFVVVFLLVVGLSYSFLGLSDSWIKTSLIAVTLVTGALWLVSHGKVRRVGTALKFTLALVMIFSISFTAVEGYLLWNAGYPATYTPTQPTVTLSLQKMLNASVEQIVQRMEDSQTFALLKLEHGSDIIFESMNLSPSNGYLNGGYISVDFASSSGNKYFHCYSADGHQFIIQVTTYNGQLISQQPSQQTVDVALKQIDALGLNWFYNQALEIAQNRTLNLPSVDSVVVTLALEEGFGGYQGLSLQLTGFHQTVQPNGNINGDGVLISEFQPNGTLIYMSQPQ
jgi:hypothetical protein